MLQYGMNVTFMFPMLQYGLIMRGDEDCIISANNEVCEKGPSGKDIDKFDEVLGEKQRKRSPESTLKQLIARGRQSYSLRPPDKVRVFIYKMPISSPNPILQFVIIVSYTILLLLLLLFIIIIIIIIILLLLLLIIIIIITIICLMVHWF